MEEQKKKNSGVMIGTVLALVIAVASYGFYKYSKKEDSNLENGVLPPATPSADIVEYTYKNGIYSTIGNYNSPGGAEEIGVKITLANDIVTDVVLTPMTERPISLKMQNAVSASVKSLVVGKKLDEIKLDKVSGSSLTPKGFNEALEEIKIAAKA